MAAGGWWQESARWLGLGPLFEPVDPESAAAVERAQYGVPYVQKRLWLAYVLWGTTGVFGGHRVYLERLPSAFAMALTGGGAGVWWLVDAFKLRGMVERFAAEQQRRHDAGEPPVGFDDLPAASAMPAAPPTSLPTLGKAGLALDAAALWLFAYLVVASSKAMGLKEPVLVLVTITALSLAGPMFNGVRSLPFIAQVLHLHYALTRFYHHYGIARSRAVWLRPLALAVLAPFSRRVRTEGRIYMELSAVFTVLSLALWIVRSVFIGLSFPHPKDWVFTNIKIFITLYLFVGPVLATMARLDITAGPRVVRGMAAWCLFLVAYYLLASA